MIRFFKIFFILNFLITHTFAQPAIDSLVGLLQNELQPRNKLVILNTICETTISKQDPRTLFFAGESFRIASELQLKKPTAVSAAHLGLIHWYQGNYAEALKFFLNQQEIAFKLNDEAFQAQALFHLGLVYEKMHDLNQALRYFQQASTLAQEVNQIPLDVRSKIRMGVIYTQELKPDIAMKYFSTSLAKLQNSKDTLSIAEVYMALSQLYEQARRPDIALKYNELATQLFQLLQRPYGQVQAAIQKASIYMQEDKKQDALDVLLKTLPQALRIQAKAEISLIHHKCADIYQNLGYDKPALQALKLHKMYQDSIYSNESRVLISDLKTQQNLASKNREIDILRKARNKLSNQNSKDALTRVWLVSILIVLSTLIFTLLYVYLRQKRHSLHLSKQFQETKIHSEGMLKERNKYKALNIEKNTLIKNVAHDLKAPLNRVYGLTELINLEQNRLSNDQKKYLNLISQITHDARIMIQNWLDIKAIEEKQLKLSISDVNLNELLDNLLVGYREQAAKKDIKLNYQNYYEEAPVIRSDSNFIGRILDNLVSNALKFSPPHKNVTIKLYESEGDFCFSIQDEGIGIREEDRSKLFKKFQRLSARPTGGETSTGLGLSIVKNLVDHLKGKILVESEVGHGTIFTVILPKQKIISKAASSSDLN